MKKIVKRMRKPTPPFFKKTRSIGLTLIVLGTFVFATPVALPAIAGKIAGYITVAGVVMSAVSQAVVADKTE